MTSHSQPDQTLHMDYVPPTAVPGDIVQVFKNPGDKNPIVAIVNRVGPRTIYVSGFSNGIPSLLTYASISGIRHRTDPDLGRGLEEGTTCWDFAPQTQALRLHEAALQLLGAQIQELAQVVACERTRAQDLSQDLGQQIQELSDRAHKLESLLDDAPAAPRDSK
jgi:hypothetical protein